MFESLQIAFDAVAPFLIYLVIGWGIVRIGWTDRPFLERINSLVFRVIFPFMMFQNIYATSRDTVPSVRLMALSAFGILGLIAVLMLTVPRIVKENPRRGVIIQAIYRSNYALYGVPLSAFVFGERGAGLAGYMALIVITIFNVAAVLVLERFNTDGEKMGAGKLLKKMVQNPLLQGCALGVLFVALDWKLPSFAAKPVSALAGVATPMAMITLGGTLRFSAVRKNAKALSWVLLIKLIVLPLVFLPLGWLIGLRGAELFVLLIIFGTPVGTSTYPMAQNMGGDGELAGQAVFLSTLASLVTIFTFIFCMSEMGLLAG